jgi:type I restriction-modification system DNA methylase subunit
LKKFINHNTLDPADYRQAVMTLLFLKRLNDTFEENAEGLIQADKNEKEALCQRKFILKVRSVTETETKIITEEEKIID